MINLSIHSQPDDETCGPTSLHAIYQYYGVDVSLEKIIHEVERSLSGGTLAPLLGKHALMSGFSATLYVNNLEIFDPSWFIHGESTSEFLMSKLKKQMKYKHSRGIVQASKAFLSFLSLGGTIRFNTVSTTLMNAYFSRNIPVLTGLSATYLYRSVREWFTQDGKSVFDDLRGHPCGHFVVLCGYDEMHRRVVVADPNHKNPISHDNYYKVSSNRLINAIMLGVVTYDANLLIIEPKDSTICKPSS